jgi:ketosteroid isomerase-like protein
LGELISSPPEINPLRLVNFSTDTEQIEFIVRDMCHKDYIFRHMSEDCVFVRPTGNPLDVKGWNDMMKNDDVTMESNKLVNINRIRISENMAFVCYTTHGKFNYKGTDNDDVAVFTSVLQKTNGRLFLDSVQRVEVPRKSRPSFLNPIYLRRCSYSAKPYKARQYTTIHVVKHVRLQQASI